MGCSHSPGWPEDLEGRCRERSLWHPHPPVEDEAVPLPEPRRSLDGGASSDADDGSMFAVASMAARDLKKNAATVASTAATAVVGQDGARKAAETVEGIMEAASSGLGTAAAGLSDLTGAAAPVAAEAVSAVKEWMNIGASWWGGGSSGQGSK